MKYCNDSLNMTNSSSGNTERIPMFATYLNMTIILMMVVIVITPAVMVVRIINKTKELRTKYHFLVANLLVTNMINILVESALQYSIMILYLLGLESHSTGNTLKKFILPLHTMLRFTSVLLLIPLAVDCATIIALPLSHDNYRTNRTMAAMIAAVWGMSAGLTVISTIIVPVDIVWPLAVINFSYQIIPFILFARLTAAAFIIVTNAYLFHKVAESKRKARENKTQGNEEEATRFGKIMRLLRSQSKATITLSIVGGIDVVANIFICITYILLNHLAEDTVNIYIHEFLMYPIESAVLLSHSLTYGIYTKEIRARLPKLKICRRLWPTCPRRVSQIVPTATNQSA